MKEFKKSLKLFIDSKECKDFISKHKSYGRLYLKKDELIFDNTNISGSFGGDCYGGELSNYFNGEINFNDLLSLLYTFINKDKGFQISVLPIYSVKEIHNDEYYGNCSNNKTYTISLDNLYKVYKIYSKLEKLLEDE